MNHTDMSQISTLIQILSLDIDKGRRKNMVKNCMYIVMLFPPFFLPFIVKYFHTITLT